MDDGWYSTRRTVGVVVLQPVDEPAEFARSRRPVTSNRGTPIEKQRQCAGIRLRRRFSATATGADVKEVVDPLGRAIAAVDDGPVRSPDGSLIRNDLNVRINRDATTPREEWR